MLYLQQGLGHGGFSSMSHVGYVIEKLSGKIKVLLVTVVISGSTAHASARVHYNTPS